MSIKSIIYSIKFFIWDLFSITLFNICLILIFYKIIFINKIYIIMNIYTCIRNIIIDFINNNEYYKNKFNHHNQKYILVDLLDAVIIILRKNISH